MLTIYKASAGSGKTFTLAYEYIKTLLGIRRSDGSYRLNSPGAKHMSRRHRAILAITFTNAATEEMKSRIVSQLARLADSSQHNGNLYSQWLTKAYGCTEKQLADAAALALNELLFDYGAFNVSTIDSFFQSVLRTFSREADRQGDYELAIEDREVMLQSVSTMLDTLNYDPPENSERLIKWLAGMTLDAVARGNEYNYFDRTGRLLNGLVKELERSKNETFTARSDRLDAYLSDPELIAAFDTALEKHIKKIFKPYADAARDIADFFERNKLSLQLCSIHARLTAAVKKVPRFAADALETKAFTLSYDELTEKQYFTKANWAMVSSCPGASDLLENLRFFSSGLAQAYRQVQVYVAFRDSLARLDFIGMARESVEDYLRRNNTVLLSDTGELLSRIISDAEMPFIYERLGMRLETLLIDEFQDTSRMQWRNLKPLVSNSLAQGFDNLIIGDEKQAIYRFRNSDSELLGSEVQNRDFPKNHTLRGHLPADNTNHRSSGTVVRFNNSLFKALAGIFSADYYANVVQTPSAAFADSPGYVRVDFVCGKPKTALNAANLEGLAQDILRQHRSGYRWADIMILAARRSELTEIAAYLTDKHPEIKILSSDALLLRNSPAVRSVMSLLALVARSYLSRDIKPDSEDRYGNTADVALMTNRFNHFVSEGMDLEAALDAALAAGDNMADGALKEQIEAVRAENASNLVALVDAVIAHRLTPEQRLGEYAYIAALQDRAIAQSESFDPTLAGFLSAWERNQDKWAIRAGADADAVELMTIHRSKGLERACVHIPMCSWSMVPDKGSDVWVPLDGMPGFDPGIVPPLLSVNVTGNSVLLDETVSPVADFLKAERRADIIDRLNMTYVAFTRASKELIIRCHCVKYDSVPDCTGNIAGILHAALGAAPQADAAEHTVDLSSHFSVLSSNVETPEGVPLEARLELGKPTEPAEKSKNTGSGLMASGIYTVYFRSDTRRIMSIDDALSTELDTGDEVPADIVAPAKPFVATPEMREAARVGSNLHAVLSTMRTLDDLDTSLAWQCAREKVDDEEAAAYRAELVAAIEAGGEQVRRWFAPGEQVLAERTIYDPADGRAYRPDRVVIDADGNVAVIDYKFTTGVQSSHKHQVAHYVRLFGELGYDNVEAYLWYPLLRRIIKCNNQR